MVIPMDTPQFGEHALGIDAINNYKNDKLYHRSALYSLVMDNLANYCFERELSDLLPQIIYS